MGAAGIQKVCVICGEDVANRPRTKDQQGRYYCNPCWDAKTSQTIEDRSHSVLGEEDIVEEEDPFAALAGAVTTTSAAPLQSLAGTD